MAYSIKENKERKCLECGKISSCYGIVKHIRGIHKMEPKDYYDKHFKKPNEGLCECCGKEAEFINVEIGYKNTCSKKCSMKLMVENVKKTKTERYGDPNYNNYSQIKETKKEVYGDEQFNNREQFVETMLDKYGVEYGGQMEDCKKLNRARMKESGFGTNYFKNRLLDIYGVEHYNQTDEGKDKIKKNIRDKKIGFGSAGYKNTIKEIYGVDNISQHPENKKKVRESHKRTSYKRKYKLLNKNFKILFTEDDYLKDFPTYDLQCKVCDTIKSFPLYNLDYIRCPKCFPTGNQSLGEKEVFDYIESLLPNVQLYRNSRNIVKGCELDIYIPTKNIAFEYNGLYWHSDTKVGKTYHNRKTELCEEKGIKLIHIFEDDWINKKDIVKNRIKNILGLIDTKFYARKCIIKEISSNEKNKFLEQYHLQGTDKSSIKLGAFYNDKLVSVMTFGSLRTPLGQKNKIGTYELLRFCSSTVVIGIANKFLKYFINTYQPKEIISYANRCWSNTDNNVYQKMGFKLDSVTGINYWYIINNKKEHRYNWRKHVLKNKLKIFDSTLSEWKNMQNNGYDRIWDCGNLKYKLVL